MTLSTSAYLVGLITIAIPIAIHLWSKKTRKTIPFGTVRFLKEDDTQAIKSLIPTEWFLLFLRVLILVVLVLIMSEPLWKRHKEPVDLVLIDPAYGTHPNFVGIRDSLNEKADTRWFSRGFPAISDSLRRSNASHWELLKLLEKTSEDKITIISPRRVADFSGTRPKESTVTWVSLPQNSRDFELGNFVSNAGSTKITVLSDNHFTKYAHSKSSTSFPDSLIIKVTIESDETYEQLTAFIIASIQAINDDSPLTIELVERGREDWLIWLKAEEAPKRRNLLFARNTFDAQIIEEISNNMFAISGFQLEEFLSYNFPIQLERVLGAAKVDTSFNDWRELPEDQLPVKTVNADSAPLEIGNKETQWFWALLVLILLVERFLSLKTRVAE